MAGTIEPLQGKTRTFGQSVGLSMGLGLLALFGLSGCETTSSGDLYSRMLDACDQRAGACYKKCEAYSEDEGRSECQQDCSIEVDQCFADVGDRIAEISERRAIADAVFYGMYGAYYPGRGYHYGHHGYAYSYAPWRRDRHGYSGSYGRSRYGSGYGRYGWCNEHRSSRGRHDDRWHERDYSRDGRRGTDDRGDVATNDPPARDPRDDNRVIMQADETISSRPPTQTAKPRSRQPSSQPRSQPSKPAKRPATNTSKPSSSSSSPPPRRSSPPASKPKPASRPSSSKPPKSSSRPARNTSKPSSRPSSDKDSKQTD